MGDHSLRVNRATYQQHADDTHANLGNLRSSADESDRQQGYLQNMTEDGVGSEEMGAVRSSSRHSFEDVNNHSTKLTNRTSENADEFIQNVKRSAQQHLKH